MLPSILSGDRNVQIAQKPGWRALAISIALHAGVLTTTPYWGIFFLEVDSILNQSVEEAIASTEGKKRLIWYRLPPVPPPIKDASTENARSEAQAEKLSESEVVAKQENARSANQLIYREDASRLIEETEPLKNMVAASAAPSTVSPQRRKAPIPSDRRPDKTVSELELPPEMERVTSTSELTLKVELARLPKPAPKVFRPPPVERKAEVSGRTEWQAPPELAAASAMPSNSFTSIARLPKPPPAKFKPPSSVASNSPATSPSLDFGSVPELEIRNQPSPGGQPSLEVARLAKPAPRKFTAPAGNLYGTGAEGRGKRIEFGEALAIGAAPSGSLSSPTTEGVSANGIPRLARRKAPIPSSGSSGGGGSLAASTTTTEAPPSLTAGSGLGTAGAAASTVAVLNLNPGNAIAPPDAAMGGNFSRAKKTGEPSAIQSRDPNALAIPGVSARSGFPASGDLRLQTPEQILGMEAAEGFYEIKLELARQWPRLSVPLAPSKRMVPRRIEPYFRQRSVFTVVVPIERLDRYAGDWIIWFSPSDTPAEAEAGAFANTKMETPLPFWKLESKRWLVRGGEQGIEQRVQLLVQISREGRVRLKDILGRYNPSFNQMVANDISRWVFRPAKQDGRSIDVDAVVEIPFLIPSQLASLP